MTRVHIDHAALARIAKSREAKAAAHKVAEGVASSVRAQGITVGAENGDPDQYPLPVLVSETPSVVLAHPAGVAVQAKHGALTRAAADNGMTVRG